MELGKPAVPFKSCFVQYCRNTTIRTPSKRFVSFPRTPARRIKWFKAIKRESEYELKLKSYLNCCEDHFDFKNDMINYLKYEMMGGRIFLKKGVVPHIFDWPETDGSAAQQINFEETVNGQLLTNSLEKNLNENCKIEIGEHSIIGNDNIKKEIDIKTELEEFDESDSFNIEVPIKQEYVNSSSSSVCGDFNLKLKVESEEQNEAVSENTSISNFINKIKEEIKVKSEETSSNLNYETVIKEEFQETSSNNENGTSKTENKALKTNRFLRKQQKVHKGNIKYLCNICKKSFSQNSSLSRHVAIHGEEKYKCNVCEKSFCLLSYLKRHQLYHTGQGKYQCSHCEKRFTQSSSLKNHLEIHVGEKKYRCKYCKKSFTLNDYLNRHLIIHKNETKYRCTIGTNSSDMDVNNLKGKINCAFKKLLVNDT